MRRADDMQGRRCPLRWCSPLFLLHVFLFGFLAWGTLYVALERFIARDEGFYLYAAKLVSKGYVPYRDFFFPQAPLSPYLYGLWMTLTDFSWTSARIGAGLCTIGCGVLIFLFTRAYFGVRAALISLPLFTMTAGIQLWMPVAKNTVLAVFLLLLSLYLGLIKKRPGWAAFCMGLCVATRLTYAPLGFLLLVPSGNSRREYVAQLKATFLGGLPAVLLMGVFYVVDPFNFVQDNWVYHQQRSNLSEAIFARKRWRLSQVLFGMKRGAGMGGYQVLALGICSLLTFFSSFRRLPTWWPLVIIVAILFVVSLLPEPAYLQYFSPFVMLLVPLAAEGLRFCASLPTRFTQKPLVRVLGSLALITTGVVLFGLEGRDDFKRFLITGDDVIGVGVHNRKAWRLGFVSKISQEIDKHNVSNKPVFASWPGYLLESNAEALPGTENQFGHTWAAYQRFNDEEQSMRHIMSQKRVAEAYQQGAFDLYAIFIGKGRTTPLERAVRKDGLKRVGIYEGFSLYSRDG